MKRWIVVTGVAALAIAATSHAAATVDYAWNIPAGFPAPHVPADNPMSHAKVALGCRLFFDTRLSSTGAYSCASCHRPELAFTDGRGQSIGATGQLTSRGAMSLANLAHSPAYTWASDRALTLEAQMALPLYNAHPVEMGLTDQSALLESLRDSDSDARAFAGAFDGEPDPVSMVNVIKAIAAFERTLLSGGSAFDRYVFNDELQALSAQAKRGMALFFSDRTGCTQCHSGLNFAGPTVHRSSGVVTARFANTGIYRDDSADRGLIEVSGQAHDLGKFRIVTLRNIALTAPYMHDGSLATLDAVIDHYLAVGRKRDARLDSRLKSFTLTDDERADLVNFLHALTDQEFANESTWRCAGRIAP